MTRKGFYVYFLHFDSSRYNETIYLNREKAEKAALKMCQEEFGTTFRSVNEMRLTFDNMNLFDREGTVLFEEIEIDDGQDEDQEDNEI